MQPVPLRRNPVRRLRHFRNTSSRRQQRTRATRGSSLHLFFTLEISIVGTSGGPPTPSNEWRLRKWTASRREESVGRARMLAILHELASRAPSFVPSRVGPDRGRAPRGERGGRTRRRDESASQLGFSLSLTRRPEVPRGPRRTPCRGAGPGRVGLSAGAGGTPGERPPPKLTRLGAVLSASPIPLSPLAARLCWLCPCLILSRCSALGCSRQAGSFFGPAGTGGSPTSAVISAAQHLATPLTRHVTSSGRCFGKFCRIPLESDSFRDLEIRRDTGSGGLVKRTPPREGHPNWCRHSPLSRCVKNFDVTSRIFCLSDIFRVNIFLPCPDLVEYRA